MNQIKKNTTLTIIVIVIFLIIVVIANLGKNKENRETTILKCPHCDKMVQELTEYNICKNCYTYFMGLEASKQQQWLVFFKNSYNEKGEKIK